MSNHLIFGLFRQIYTSVIYLGSPLLSRYLNRRIASGKEDPDRILERKGLTDIPRPDGKVIWVHGASVGESLSVLPVIEDLLEKSDNLFIVLTTGTMSSANMLKDRLPERTCHQYTPLDHPDWIANFLRHWQPSVVVWLESEFWPNILHGIKQQKIPLVLLNGRVSDQSFTRWKKIPFIIGPMLAMFDDCLAQSGEDSRRLTYLGARNAVNHGNIKLGAPPLPADETILADFSAALGDRPRWMLSSSHDGEETLAGDIHLALADGHPELLSLIVPRHPTRGVVIAESLRARGIKTGLRSAGDKPESHMGAYVADTVGELGIYYRLCDIVVIGKSFITPGGGQNPFEATKLEKAVILGPHMSNFTEITETMLQTGAAIQVSDRAGLQREIGILLDNPERVKSRKLAAREFSQSAENVTGKTANLILKYL